MASPYYVSTPTTAATTEVSRFAYSLPAPQCQLLYPQQHTGSFQTSTPALFFANYVAPPRASTDSASPHPTSTNSAPLPTTAPPQQTAGSSTAKLPTSNTAVSAGRKMTSSSSGGTSTAATTTTTSISSAVTKTQCADKEAVTTSAPTIASAASSTAWKPTKAPAKFTRRPKSTISRLAFYTDYCKVQYSNGEAYRATYTVLMAILNDCIPADLVNIVSGMNRNSMHNDFLQPLFQQTTFEQFWLTTTSESISDNWGSHALTNLVNTLPTAMP
uniref:Uncharacterized protein n=1 Tax=Panagrolaimus davidi TaxID=227884 RepID=A0A914PSZ7_9BILA